jgi:hypothetical protein
MAETLKVTIYDEDERGFWIMDSTADQFVVPFEVVEIKTSKGGEIVFVGADGREVNAIDIKDGNLH